MWSHDNIYISNKWRPHRDEQKQITKCQNNNQKNEYCCPILGTKQSILFRYYLTALPRWKIKKWKFTGIIAIIPLGKMRKNPVDTIWLADKLHLKPIVFECTLIHKSEIVFLKCTTAKRVWILIQKIHKNSSIRTQYVPFGTNTMLVE